MDVNSLFFYRKVIQTIKASDAIDRAKNLDNGNGTLLPIEL